MLELSEDLTLPSVVPIICSNIYPLYSLFLNLAQRLFLLFNTRGPSLQEHLNPQHPAKPIRRNCCFRVSDIPLLSPFRKGSPLDQMPCPQGDPHARHYVISLTTSSSSPSDYILRRSPVDREACWVLKACLVTEGWGLCNNTLANWWRCHISHLWYQTF